MVAYTSSIFKVNPFDTSFWTQHDTPLEYDYWNLSVADVFFISRAMTREAPSPLKHIVKVYWQLGENLQD